MIQATYGPGPTPPHLERILSRLQKARQSTSGWMACCPAHDDQNPSLSINVGDDGRVLVNCFAGCGAESVVESLGMKMADLMPSAEAWAKPRQRTVTVYPTQQEAAAAASRAARGKTESLHNYEGADGSPAFAVVRIRLASGKSFRPIAPAGDGWSIGGATGPLPLFHIRSVIDAAEVVVVEGEKCVDAVADLGFAATTSAHGAGSARNSNWSPLAGKRVVLLPDNDDAGRKYASEVGAILRSLDPPAQVHLLTLDGLAEGDDVVDWIDAQRTCAIDKPEIVEDLARRLEAAEAWNPNFAVSAVSAGPESNTEWNAPEPLEPAAELPKFPVEQAFPEYLAKLREFAQSTAVAFQVPVDAVAMLLLPVMALPLSKRFVVEPQPGWREQLSIYVVVLMPSGERKTAVMDQLTRPIYAWQHDQASGLGPALAAYENETSILKERLRKARKSAAAKPTTVDNLGSNDLARQIAELERAAPKPPRLIATEATTEAVGQMLTENHERGLSACAEGDVLDVMLGRYSGAPNLGVWLCGHSGDPIDSLRRGRAADRLEHPALQVSLCVQPDAIRGLLTSSAARGRGLLARFFFSLPKSLVGYRELTPPPVPAALVDWYGVRLQQHLDQPVLREPIVLRLEPDASALLHAFREDNEAALRPEGALGVNRSWGSKLPGAIVRIAGVLSAVAFRPSIDADTMRCALAWAPYLTAHYEHVAQLAGADEALHVAMRVNNWILRSGKTTFTRRDAFNGVRDGQIQKVDHIDPALELLIERNRIRQQPAPPLAGKGRPPSPSFQVNPLLCDSELGPQKAQNTQNSAAPSRSAPTGGAA